MYSIDCLERKLNDWVNAIGRCLKEDRGLALLVILGRSGVSPSKFQEEKGGPITRKMGGFRNLDYSVKKEVEKGVGPPRMFLGWFLKKSGDLGNEWRIRKITN